MVPLFFIYSLYPYLLSPVYNLHEEDRRDDMVEKKKKMIKLKNDTLGGDVKNVVWHKT